MTYLAGRTFRESSPFLKPMLGKAKPGEKEATMDMDASHYFNNNETRAAMHLTDFNGTWS
jgi:hypothetical protein